MLVDIFRPLPPEARRENLAAYKSFLAHRDGALDLEKNQPRRREEGMLRYETPLSRIREIDRDLFAPQSASSNSKAETPPEVRLRVQPVWCNRRAAYVAH